MIVRPGRPRPAGATASPGGPLSPAIPGAGPSTPAWAGPGAPSGDVIRIMHGLRTPTLWVDPGDRVLWAHPALETMRVVRRGTVRIAALTAMVDQARGLGQVVQRDMSVPRPGRRQQDYRLRVRVVPMAQGAALVLVEDVSEAERLELVRRDFVANVSHEVKTPIGALSLLAEAVVEARDDPAAVARFAERMTAETRRLATLVNDLMDLSRLEGMDRPEPMGSVSIDDVVDRACDDAGLLAREKGILLLRGGERGLQVRGVESQLVTAVRNLIVNAVNYSPAATKVGVTTRLVDGLVTVAVKDQGIGIPPTELERIFERFYRVDPARSRHTGGTGLGLAIVKHICTSHGGTCEVWSRVGEGSTFSIRLPAQPGASGGAVPPAAEEGS